MGARSLYLFHNGDNTVDQSLFFILAEDGKENISIRCC